MQKSKNELQGIKEDFCKTTLEDKEVSWCCFCPIILLVIALCALMLIHLQVIL